MLAASSGQGTALWGPIPVIALSCQTPHSFFPRYLPHLQTKASPSFIGSSFLWVHLTFQRLPHCPSPPSTPPHFHRLIQTWYCAFPVKNQTRSKPPSKNPTKPHTTVAVGASFQSLHQSLPSLTAHKETCWLTPSTNTIPVTHLPPYRQWGQILCKKLYSLPRWLGVHWFWGKASTNFSKQFLSYTTWSPPQFCFALCSATQKNCSQRSRGASPKHKVLWCQSLCPSKK